MVNQCHDRAQFARIIFVTRSNPMQFLPTGVVVTKSGISVDPHWADRFLPKPFCLHAEAQPFGAMADRGRSDKEARTTRDAGINLPATSVRAN